MILKREAPAKINLGLHVGGKRPDGYHNLETVLVCIPWADTLTVRPASQLTLTCSDSALPTDERNLCLKAARALACACNVRQGAALHLEKHVPYGAGLGGGSSDAAATLRLLTVLWELEVTDDALHDMAADIGSDVPFFLGPQAAYATGRGTQLAPLYTRKDTLYRLPFTLVVAVPAVQVPTAAAYRHVQPSAQHRPDLRAVVCSNDLARWRRELVNDFEAPVEAQYPGVQAVRHALLEGGAGYAALSGSGSAVVGVFADEAAAEAAAEQIQQEEDVRAVRCFRTMPTDG